MRVTGLAKVVCYDFASLYRGSFWQLLFKQSFFRVNIAVATYTITLSLGFVFPQFTSSSFYVSFLSRVEMNSTNWPAPNAWVFIAQLAEHCSANAEVMGSNPVEVPNFFFGLICNCLTCSCQCETLKSFAGKNYSRDAS